MATPHLSLPYPYSLNASQPSSREYYPTISAFAERWLESARPIAAPIAADLQRSLRTGELPGSLDECAFELLAIGVLLREHGWQAAHLSGLTAWLLGKLSSLQSRLPRFEKPIKKMRGLVGGLSRVWRSVKGPIYATPEDVERVRLWLHAQGETTQAERLSRWIRYFQLRSSGEAHRVVMLCRRMADEFARESLAALGKFTRETDHYRALVENDVRWRYDSILVTRTRLDTHFGMLGTEILNRAYRTRYQNTRRRLAIVPPCLRARPDAHCQAVQTPLGARCSGCTPACPIHQMTRLGEKHGVPVVSIPDDQLTQLCLASGQAGSQLGVVGVACALRNWSAGWEAEKLGLNAQGMLLDYPGCQKHWMQPGVTTQANLDEFENLLTL